MITYTMIFCLPHMISVFLIDKKSLHVVSSTVTIALIVCPDSPTLKLVLNSRLFVLLNTFIALYK